MNVRENMVDRIVKDGRLAVSVFDEKSDPGPVGDEPVAVADLLIGAADDDNLIAMDLFATHIARH